MNTTGNGAKPVSSVATGIRTPHNGTKYLLIERQSVDTIFTALDRHQLIARAAYCLAERRHFQAGQELDDWLRAEYEVDSACGLIEPEPHWPTGSS